MVAEVLFPYQHSNSHSTTQNAWLVDKVMCWYEEFGCNVSSTDTLKALIHTHTSLIKKKKNPN
jgi:methionine salvage enolase-phosphatase E1